MPLTVMRIPDDEELLMAVNASVPSFPPVSTKKILATFRRTHPNWKVTERRLKKLRNLGGAVPRRSLGSDDTDVWDSEGEDGCEGAPWLLVTEKARKPSTPSVQDGIDDEEYVLVAKDHHTA
mmetsp:Transcript_38560/g.75331  ORF Transcript_38560/g.75331 Transcript_38560/m.75331 type:complete len:122 (-) Transcript_38560:647-1012(-)